MNDVAPVIAYWCDCTTACNMAQVFRTVTNSLLKRCYLRNMSLATSRDLVFEIKGACINGHLTALKLMFAAGVIPDESLPVQLRIAAANGHLHIAKFLLAKGHRDMFAKNHVYILPIHRGHTEMVKLLARAQGIDHVGLEHNLLACGTKFWVDWLRTGMFDDDWSSEDFPRSCGLFTLVLRHLVKCPDRTELLRKVLARGITMDAIVVDDPSVLSVEDLSFLSGEGLVASKDALDTALLKLCGSSGYRNQADMKVHNALRKMGARFPAEFDARRASAD